MWSPIKIFFAGWVVLTGLSLRAQSTERNWDFSGQLLFDWRYFQKPSSVNGSTAFQLPWLSLSAVRQFEDQSELTFEIAGATPTANQIEVFFRRVSLRLPEAVAPSTDLEVGLIESGVTEIQRKYWSLSRLATEMDFPFQRWGYLPDTDYGVQIHSLLGDNWTLGLEMTNGEGRGMPEQSAHKDLLLWMAVEWSTETDRNWLITLQAARGGYPNVSQQDAAKERAAIGLWTSRHEGPTAHLEYLWASDPADAIDGKVAEQADLTAFGGTRVYAKGYSAHLSYDWQSPDSKRWSVFWRGDRWEPVRDQGNKAIESSHWGLVYGPRRNLQWVIYSAQTRFADQHSNAVRDQQSWRVSVFSEFN